MQSARVFCQRFKNVFEARARVFQFAKYFETGRAHIFNFKINLRWLAYDCQSLISTDDSPHIVLNDMRYVGKRAAQIAMFTRVIKAFN